MCCAFNTCIIKWSVKIYDISQPTQWCCYIEIFVNTFKGCRQIFEAYKLTFAYTLISTNFTIQVYMQMDVLSRVSVPITIGYMIYGYTVTVRISRLATLKFYQHHLLVIFSQASHDHNRRLPYTSNHSRGKTFMVFADFC